MATIVAAYPVALNGPVALGILAAWVLSEIAVRLFLLARTGRRPSSLARDRGSGAGIVVAILVTVLVPPFFYSAFPQASFPGIAAGIAVALAAVGIGLRIWALVSLGRFFSVVVEFQPGHRVVRDGPYRWLRHPAYTAVILVALGYACAVGSFPGLLVAGGAMVAAILFRVHVEEQALLERFPDEYAEYRRRTWRLLPFLY